MYKSKSHVVVLALGFLFLVFLIFTTTTTTTSAAIQPGMLFTSGLAASLALPVAVFQTIGTVSGSNNSPKFLPAPPPPSELNQTNAYFQQVDSQHDFYDEDSWTLWTNLARNNTFSIQPYSANGYIGVRIPVEGQGFAVDQNYSDPDGLKPHNGWPLDNERFTGCYIAGFWDTQKNTTRTNFPELLKRGGESVISTIPQWTPLQIRDHGSQSIFAPEKLGVKGIETYYQGLSLKDGVVQTNVTWTPPHAKNDVSYKLNYTVVTHRTRPNLGIVRLDITASCDSDIDISDILDGAASMRTVPDTAGVDGESKLSIFSAVHPHWTNVTGYEYSTLWLSDKSCVGSAKEESDWASNHESTASQQISVKLRKGETFTAIKYVGITSTDAYPVNAYGAAKEASKQAQRDGWDKLVEENSNQWASLWDSADIIIPSDIELQKSARATLFHLLANVRDGSERKGFNDNSIAVGGLSSDSYGGLIFWDADLWMSPGLSVLHPNHAASINNYRHRTRKQAILNAQSYNESGALYPWTSGRWGNCTGTGPCVDYQYHLNIDIALENWNYYLQSKDQVWLEQIGYPIMRDAANFFADFVVKNGSYYETKNLTDPDEYANHVNNGAYTNGAIMQLMKWVGRASEILGKEVDPKWVDISTKMKIPENTTVDLTLEFDGMNGTAAIKQADIVLLQYPMEFPQTESRAETNLNYYAERQSPDGPAMTYAIFAIDKAQLNKGGCSSYTYLLYANQPYLRRPYYQFSEQLNDNAYTNGGTHPAFPFLTGHGGYLQAYTHGLTGYRPREDVFYLDPVLFPQLKDGVTIKGMKFQGAVFDVDITPDETTISRRPDRHFKLLANSTEYHTGQEIIVQIADRNEMAGNHSMKVGDVLKVPTYRADLNSTAIDGNLVECRPVNSKDAWVAGNYPFSINDGDNSTSWQPLHAARSAITLDLGKAEKFQSAHALWGGESVPKKISIGIPQGYHGVDVSEASKADKFHWIVRDFPITLSKPWINGTNTSIIRIEPGNETFFNFDSSFQSRFVQIEIEGSYLNDTKGGRVAEFSLL